MSRQLTVEEKQYYDEHGYVIVPDVFTREELVQVDNEMDRLLAAGAEANHRGWIHGLGSRSEFVRRFARDDRVLDLVEGVVYPGIALHSAKLVTKVPYQTDECHWHQDEAYYYKGNEETKSYTRMSVWIPLRDTDERNGCLWVLPGSHRWGLKSHHRVDYGQCLLTLDEIEEALKHAISVPMQAGSMLLFSSWTWHHSKGNETDQLRRAFIISYQEATVRTGKGKEHKILRPAAALA